MSTIATVLARVNGEFGWWNHAAAQSLMLTLSPITQVADLPQIEIPILPEGEWPKKKAVEESPEKAAVKKLFTDNSRLAFLAILEQTENVEMKVVEVLMGGKRKLRYEGVVVRTHTGKLIALLDCPLYCNALYAFDAAVPDWMAVAKMTKHQLRASHPTAFIKPFWHKGDWQRNVLNFLRG